MIKNEILNNIKRCESHGKHIQKQSIQETKTVQFQSKVSKVVFQKIIPLSNKAHRHSGSTNNNEIIQQVEYIFQFHKQTQHNTTQHNTTQHNRTEQNKTEQNRTEQNKTKQKHNKT